MNRFEEAKRRAAESKSNRIERPHTARELARDGRREGSFAILVGDDIHGGSNLPEAKWFSRWSLEDGSLSVLRHTSVNKPEWQKYSYGLIWGAADDKLAECLEIVKEVERGSLLETICEINPHVAEAVEEGTMGAGIIHPTAGWTEPTA